MTITQRLLFAIAVMSGLIALMPNPKSIQGEQDLTYIRLFATVLCAIAAAEAMS